MNTNNYCIIMAGGLGSRFWPISQPQAPKQFLDILGTGETMLQSTVRRYSKVCPLENIYIVTGESMIGRVMEQIPGLKPEQVLLEPYRRNTAPCVAYAASAIRAVNPNATVVVTPSDHAIFDEDRFVESLQQAFQVCERQDWIVTMGVPPTAPISTYGYIQNSEEVPLPSAPDVHDVVAFTEKPSVSMAKSFIATGEFLWNVGIFVWRLPVLLDAFKRHLPAIASSFLADEYTDSPQHWEQVYSTCESISVDFGIMEKADNVHVLKANFGWSDVETWDSLFLACPKDSCNNAIVAGDVFTYDVHNCVVKVPHTKTLVLQGLDCYVIASSDDTLMICRRGAEDQVFRFANDVEFKKLVDKKG